MPTHLANHHCRSDTTCKGRRPTQTVLDPLVSARDFLAETMNALACRYETKPGYTLSAAQIRAYYFLPLAFGAKWLNMFRWAAPWVYVTLLSTTLILRLFVQSAQACTLPYLLGLYATLLIFASNC